MYRSQNKSRHVHINSHTKLVQFNRYLPDQHLLTKHQHPLDIYHHAKCSHSKLLQPLMSSIVHEELQLSVRGIQASCQETNQFLRPCRTPQLLVQHDLETKPRANITATASDEALAAQFDVNFSCFI